MATPLSNASEPTLDLQFATALDDELLNITPPLPQKQSYRSNFHLSRHASSTRPPPTSSHSTAPSTRAITSQEFSSRLRTSESQLRTSAPHLRDSEPQLRSSSNVSERPSSIHEPSDTVHRFIPSSLLQFPDVSNVFEPEMNLLLMDRLYNSSFFDFIKDEQNVYTTARKLYPMVTKYGLKHVAVVLRWLMHGWSMSSIAKLIKIITSDWNPDICGLLVHLLTIGWVFTDTGASFPEHVDGTATRFDDLLHDTESSHSNVGTLRLAAVMISGELPDTAALFIKSLTKSQQWSSENVTELVSFLDSALSWDENYFKLFTRVFEDSAPGVTKLSIGYLTALYKTNLAIARYKLALADFKLAMAEQSINLQLISGIASNLIEPGGSRATETTESSLTHLSNNEEGDEVDEEAEEELDENCSDAFSAYERYLCHTGNVETDAHDHSAPPLLQPTSPTTLTSTVNQPHSASNLSPEVAFPRYDLSSVLAWASRLAATNSLRAQTSNDHESSNPHHSFARQLESATRLHLLDTSQHDHQTTPIPTEEDSDIDETAREITWPWDDATNDD